MFNWIIASALVGFVLILIAMVVIRKISIKNSSRKNIAEDLQNINTEKVKNLELVDVLSFFKQPKVLERLQSDQDLIAVAIKEWQENDTISIMLCLYSKGSSTLVSPEKCFIAETLSDDLRSLFGEKDMIVLQ